MNTQKRICVINDISCEGRCSVTAALPIFAAAGIHGNLIPTALLSTQTGGYTDYTFLDLSAEMEKIAAHFKSLDLKFDVLYSGYLAGESQIDTVCKIADMLEAKSFIVDTVMGDGGKLYPGFTKDFCNKMKLLCKRADIITPNLTEACFLLDMDYSRVCEDDIEEITDGLLSLGAKNAVVTGLKNKNGEMGVAAFNGKER
ncbi:MAG: bifunctional hydroxymethylpyrimidine kinase/phosphomethylpyrimidine kinase, partial [Clostridia bacterium]|nr:bifunctional hydroxymethylpyrimidine kinase/phosphomethylpyrimidine kinase [Clostridia bacterium]